MDQRSSVAAATAVVLAALLVACSDAPVSESPQPHLTRGSPAATASETPAALAAGDLGEVATQGLRASSTAGGAPILAIEEGRGASVIRVEPVDGLSWYLIEFNSPGGDLFGWIPAHVDGRPTLTRLPAAECREPSVGWVGTLDPADRLRCWGDEQIALDGYVVERPWPDAAYSGAPSWLANDAGYVASLAIGPAVDGPYVPVHFSPDVEVPPLTPRDGPIAEGALIRLTGQFDHPASATCDRSPTSSAYPHLEADLILLWCRQQFVVESWEPVNE